MPLGSYCLCGVLIGLLFGVPVGAVGTMTVRNTLSGGMRAGLRTGLGSSVADCLYAAVGVFGFNVLSDFLLRYQFWISMVGGIFIAGMGLSLLFKKATASQKTANNSHGRMFLTSFCVGITNPAAILTFLFAFSYFGITPQKNFAMGFALVSGVFLGTYLWWFALSALTAYLHKRNGRLKQEFTNRIFGAILFLFGVVMILQTIFRR